MADEANSTVELCCWSENSTDSMSNMTDFSTVSSSSALSSHSSSIVCSCCFTVDFSQCLFSTDCSAHSFLLLRIRLNLLPLVLLLPVREDFSTNCFQFSSAQSHQRVGDRRVDGAACLRRRQRRLQLSRPPVVPVREEAAFQLRHSDRQPGGRRLHRQHHPDDAVHGEHSRRVRRAPTAENTEDSGGNGDQGH